MLNSTRKLRVYHFTTLDCYEHIRTEGIRPYPVYKGFFGSNMNPDQLGIWAWPSRPEGHALVGQIVMSALRAHDWHIACLSFEVDSVRDRIHPANLGSSNHLEVFHNGSLGSYNEDPRDRVSNRGPWVYHIDEPVFLVNREVAPDEVTLDAAWDLEDFAGRGSHLTLSGGS